MTLHAPLAGLAAALLAAASNPPAYADVDPGASESIEVLVITAPRIDKAVDDVPAAVSVVDQDAIQRAQPQLTLDEPLRRIPGVVIQNRGNFAQDLRIAIRGFGARSNFGIRGIRLYVDGIPATLPDGQAQVDNLDLGSAQHIEVIRGPTSSLYGPAAGGVILVESQSGVGNPFANARVAIGDYGYRKYQIKGGGNVGAVDSFASVSRLELDGYRDHSRTENILLNTRFGVRIDESSDLGLVLNVVHAPIGDDPGGLTAVEVADDRRQAAPNNLRFDAGESVDQQQFGLVYRKSFGKHHEVEAVNYYAWRQFDSRLPFMDGGSVDLDRFFGGGSLRYAYASKLLGHDHRLMLGFEVDAQRDVRKRFDNDEGSRGTKRFDQDENVTGIGGYAQEEFRILTDLELTLGIRYDRVEFDVDDGFPSDGDDGGSLHFDEWSPRAGLLYSPHPAAHLFANFATSFETPTTTELADPSGAGGFNSDLDAQTAWSTELGVKGTVSRWLHYEVVGFTIEVDDELVPFEVPGMPGRDFFENAGKSRRSGFELAFALHPGAGLTTSLAYTFSHFQFERFQTSAENVNGNDIPGIPRNQIWAEIAYEHPWGFYANWEVFYRDGVYADNANQVSSDAYVVSNLRAGYTGRFRGWEFGPFIGFNNLFSEAYDDNVRLNAGFGRFFEPAAKFSLYGGISLGYHFGGP